MPYDCRESEDDFGDNSTHMNSACSEYRCPCHDKLRDAVVACEAAIKLIVEIGDPFSGDDQGVVAALRKVVASKGA